MQGILASAGGGAVQTLCLAPMTAALCLGDLRLEIPVKLTRFELFPVARRDRVS